MNRRQFITSCIGAAGAVLFAPLVKLDVGKSAAGTVTHGKWMHRTLNGSDLIVGVRRQSALILDNYEVTLDEGQQILASHGIDYRPYWETRGT